MRSDLSHEDVLHEDVLSELRDPRLLRFVKIDRKGFGDGCVIGFEKRIGRLGIEFESSLATSVPGKGGDELDPTTFLFSTF